MLLVFRGLKFQWKALHVSELVSTAQCVLFTAFWSNNMPSNEAVMHYTSRWYCPGSNEGICERFARCAA
jgi:hypothetical protein